MDLEVSWDDLEIMLKHHDWYYHFSDDHRWYTAGRKQWTDIMDAIPNFLELDFDRTVELFNQYSPEKVQKEWFYALLQVQEKNV